ncbi:hypothetical protein [uncultured Flavobacterium sp.]|uniref:hypothetical protein n=1 Tax=uncultured Flavobacterium sp. TaxID=165435 RepID=UPI0025E01007|nr:hypothetical protein [uncultured Flavobacterium sp.]
MKKIQPVLKNTVDQIKIMLQTHRVTPTCLPERSRRTQVAPYSISPIFVEFLAYPSTSLRMTSSYQDMC